jgi:phage terminase large subunit
MGGRGTGRSTAGSQFDLSKLMAPDYFRGAIMRAVHSDIKNSIFQDLKDHIVNQELDDLIHIRGGNDMAFEYGKNSIQSHGFKASSGQQTGKLKSLANYTNVRIEEARDVGEKDFMTLDDSLRTKKGRIGIVFQLNPPPKNHWIAQRFFDLEEHPDWPGFFIPHPKTDTDDKFIYIGGTYLDNLENLDEATIRRYAGYERTKPEYFAQEILGLIPETVRGKIYRNWIQVDRIPREARFIGFGTDFGWYPDPLATVAVWYCDGMYYLDEVVYGTELENEYVAGEIRKYIDFHNITNAINVADAAEPKSIAAFNKAKVKTVDSLKGADAEGYRIKVTSTKKIAVTKASVNIWESYNNYAWAEDKDGNPKGTPVHTYSHAMDAIGQFFAWQEGGEKKSGRAVVSTPTFKSYGKSGGNSTGNGVKVNIPGRR